MRLIFLCLLHIFSSLVYANKEELDIFIVLGLTREQGHLPSGFDHLVKSHFSNANVYYLDLPGAGTHYKEKVPDTISGFVDFLRERNEQLFQSSRKRLIIATSLAGIVEVEWLRKYPRDFDYAVMVASSFAGICSTFERTQLKSLKKMLLMPLQNIEKREENVSKININDHDLRKSVTSQNIVVDREHPMSKQNMIRQTMAAKKYELNFKPQIPMLVIGSQADRLVKPVCIEKVANYFGAALEMHPTSGHGIPVEATQWLLLKIKNWFLEQQ